MAAAENGRGRAATRTSTGGLAIDGGRRPRLRRASPQAWTKEKEAAFIETLAETCNVKLAAAEAGVSPQRAYERRRTHAAFRAAWLEAISVAYSRLELILLERALNGTEKIVRRRDGSTERMVEYPNQVALTLLKMHRDTAIEADSELPPQDVQEIREQIIAKLDRLRAREEKRAIEGTEQSSGGARE